MFKRIRSVVTSIGIRPVLVGLVGLILIAGLARQARAYPTVHDPVNTSGTNCFACHPTFENRGDAHDLHVSPLTNTCDLCHTGSGRNNPITLWSIETNGLGCAGCHGRDYGETVQLPNGFDNGSGTFNLNGLPKMSGYGLRKQHLRKNVTVCLDCHADVPRSFILPEDVAPAYYGPAYTTNVTNPCLSDLTLGGEDSPATEPNGDDTVGLDNDGDGLDNTTTPRIDLNDPDCAVLTTTPGEAAAPVGGPQIEVTAIAGNIVTINYGSACSATNHAVYIGALNRTDMQNGNYSAADCSVAAGSDTFDAGSGDVFFLVIGDDGSDQGSYGESYWRDPSDPTFPNFLIYRERSGDPGRCSLSTPLNLSMRCD